MNTLYIVAGAFVVYLLIKWLSQKATITVPTAYAGSPKKDIPLEETLPVSYYPIHTFIDGKRISVFKYIKFIIRGRSLEKFGVKDKSLVYVSKWNKKDSMSIENLKALIGKIIILSIDNERTAIEHPLDPNFFNSAGFKARKAILIVDRNLSRDELLNKLTFLDNPNEDFPSDMEEFKNRIVEKYIFATNFYTEESNFILSITYRNDGTRLGLSFHSPKFIYGTVQHIVTPENKN